MSDYDDTTQTRRHEPTYEELKERFDRLQDQLQAEEDEIREQIEQMHIDLGDKPEKPAVPPAKTCDHLRESGLFCGSLAVGGRDYCCFHLRERGRRLKMARARARREHLPLQLPPLEDLHAVQVGIMQVLDWLFNGRLDRRDAGLALYGLQQAATNLRCPKEVWEQSSPFEIPDDEGVAEYAGFEEEFGLPKGMNVDTPPEVAFPETQPAAVSEERANLFEVTPLDIQLMEIQEREGPEAVTRRLKQLDAAEARRYRRAQKQLAHTRHVVRAAAQNAARQAGMQPQSVAAEADAATADKDQSA